MGSFAAFHLEGSLDELLPLVDGWATRTGFAEKQRFEEPPEALRSFHLSAKAVALTRMNASWCILYINGFTLPRRRMLNADAVAALGLVCPRRALLFVAQTTSDAYDLVAFEAGQRVRHLVHMDGERSVNEGARLPGERENAFPSISEWDENAPEDPPSVFEEASAICAALGFELWANPVISGPGYAWRKLGLIERWFG